MKRKFNNLFLLGIIGVLIVGSFFIADILGTFLGNKHIYWTATNMMLKFDKSSNDFEIYVKGDLMQKALDRKKLLYYEDNGTYSTLSANDFEYRLNNYYKVKSSNLTKLLFTSFFFGFFLSFLFTGFFKYVPEVQEKLVEKNGDKK